MASRGTRAPTDESLTRYGADVSRCTFDTMRCAETYYDGLAYLAFLNGDGARPWAGSECPFHMLYECMTSDSHIIAARMVTHQNGVITATISFLTDSMRTSLNLSPARSR